MPRDFVFDGLGRNVVAGGENNQIFDAADDAPISAQVHFALVARMKPAVAEDAGGFFGAIPVAGENVGAADDDFFVVGDFHLDAGNGLAHAAGLYLDARVVQRADGGGLGEAVGLQDRDAQNKQKLLRFGRERSRAADQRAKVGAEAAFDLAENKFAAERKPERIGGAGTA